MSYNVYIEMPSGALSQDHERSTEDEALGVFDLLVSQMKPWKKFSADVVLTNGKKEIKREHIANA